MILPPLYTLLQLLARHTRGLIIHDWTGKSGTRGADAGFVIAEWVLLFRR